MPNALTGSVDLTTIFGRVVAALRADLPESQAGFARVLEIDRSLLARIESGRNTASIDHIVLIEEAFIRANRIRWHGDLLILAARVAREVKVRGGMAVYGNVPRPEGNEDLGVSVLDRIVAVVVDQWLKDLPVKAEGGDGLLG
jgi:transcriptional regulator with XRE-family HTH domain